MKLSNVVESIKMDKEIRAKANRALRDKRLRLGIPTQQVETVEDAFATGGIEETRTDIDGATIRHKSDPIITMYDAEGRMRLIPEGSVRVCEQEGLFLYCPICHGEHADNDANACPSRERVKYRRCPVFGCGKKFSDDRAVPSAMFAEDPDMIPTELPGSPEIRTRVKLEQHIRCYHEQAARQMGLGINPDGASAQPEHKQ